MSGTLGTNWINIFFETRTRSTYVYPCTLSPWSVLSHVSNVKSPKFLEFNGKFLKISFTILSLFIYRYIKESKIKKRQWDTKKTYLVASSFTRTFAYGKVPKGVILSSKSIRGFCSTQSPKTSVWTHTTKTVRILKKGSWNNSLSQSFYELLKWTQVYTMVVRLVLCLIRRAGLSRMHRETSVLNRTRLKTVVSK